MTIPPSKTPRPNRPARVEITADEVQVYAPYSPDLRDALRTLPGARWVPGHWSVPSEHRDAAVELVGDVFGTPVVVDVRAAR